MNSNVKKAGSAAVLTFVAITTLLSADAKKSSKYEKSGKETSPCNRIGICGPMMPEIVNPSARPMTQDPCCCDQGEFTITLAGFYWEAREDGLEYAIRDNVTVETEIFLPEGFGLINAKYLTPNFKWKPGFKVGIGYNTTHDGWDLALLWTHYNGRAKSHIDVDSEDNISLFPLWSDSAKTEAILDFSDVWVTDLTTSWRVDLNLVDFEIGREFWTSRYLTMRPHIGLRYAGVNQRYMINSSGGFYVGETDEIQMRNNFAGVGVRGGLDAAWNFGCCDPCSGNWSLFGNAAFSIVYGRFQIKQHERQRSTLPEFGATSVLEVTDHFRASRGMLDLAFGIEWTSLYKDNTYGVILLLAWEHHQFFNQNQLWKVSKFFNHLDADPAESYFGRNLHEQTRGDLSTQGVTFTAKFIF